MRPFSKEREVIRRKSTSSESTKITLTIKQIKKLIRESMLSEGKHWPEDYVKTGRNLINGSQLRSQSWYDSIDSDLNKLADAFIPLSHKNSNLGYFSPLVKWLIEYSTSKENHDEFLNVKLEKIIKGLQLISTTPELQNKWKEKISSGISFDEFEKALDFEQQKIEIQDKEKQNQTYSGSDYKIIPIKSYNQLQFRS